MRGKVLYFARRERMNSHTVKPGIMFVIDGSQFGGGERVFLQLIAGLQDCFHISVAASPGGVFESEVKKLGVPFFPVNLRRQLSPTTVFRLRALIKAKKVDLIHSQGARVDFFCRLAVGMAGNCKLVCTVAAPVEVFNVNIFKKTIYLSLDTMSSIFVDKYIVVSEALKKRFLNKRRIHRGKIIKIYNGIESDLEKRDDTQSGARDQWGISKETLLIGAIGRLVWEKGFIYLIEAMPMILKAVPCTKLILVGDGPIANELKTRVSQLAIEEYVIFAGFSSEVKNILSIIDILAVPSLTEGFPMVTLEGMAMAKPIIATKIDGIMEQITDQEDGYLVSPRNTGQLAEAAIYMLKKPEEAERMGMAARQTVMKNFSIEKMIQETKAVYLSLC